MLTPLLEIQVQRQPGPPLDNIMDGMMATGISTIAVDWITLPNTHALVSQPIPAVVLVVEARVINIFISKWSPQILTTPPGKTTRIEVDLLFCFL